MLPHLHVTHGAVGKKAKVIKVTGRLKGENKAKKEARRRNKVSW